MTHTPQMLGLRKSVAKARTSARVRAGRAVGASVATAALVLTSLGVPAASAAPRWVDCPKQVGVAGSRCGEIDVPLEHSNPGGDKISVGFVVRPATGQKYGTLFVHPGGPGGDSYSFAAGGEKDFLFSWSPEITEHFDLVGVQQRGLMGSTPLLCDIKALEEDIKAQEAQPVPTPESFQTPDHCEGSHPGLRNSITTENSIRDMEMVRAALGLDKINLLGLSYGTYFMSAYATAYPQHVDKLVLDSSMSPRLAWTQIIATQRGGYLDRFHAMLRWIADHDATYHLGTTPYQVYQVWASQVQRESGFLPATPPPPMTPADVPAGQGAMVGVYNAFNPANQQMQAAWSKATGKANEPVSLTNVATRQIVPQMGLWPIMAEALQKGEVPEAENSAMVPELKGLSDDQKNAEVAKLISYQVMQSSILCNENHTPPNYFAFPELGWNLFVANDMLALAHIMFDSGLPCMSRPAVAALPPVDGSRLPVRPLALHGPSDPQTPWRFKDDLLRPMGATLVVVNDGNHGHVALGNPAADHVVAHYLETGEVLTTSVPGRVVNP